MKNSGVLQLEAMICFAVFLALLGGVLYNMHSMKGQSSSANNALRAKAKTELCCLALDSIYTGNVEEFVQREIPCTGKGSIVESDIGGRGKRTECIAQSIKTVQKGEESLLEVKLNDHYR